MSFVSYLEKIDRDISGAHGILPVSTNTVISVTAAATDTLKTASLHDVVMGGPGGCHFDNVRYQGVWTTKEMC